MKLGPAAVAALVFGIAIALWLPGLGDHGWWSDFELPIVDRASAALGAAVRGMERSPWLPDKVRSVAYDWIGAEFGIRLPHALAAAGLCAIAASLCRRRGSTVGISLIAGLIAMSLPVVAISGRTVLGNPIGELLSATTVLFGAMALGSTSRVRTLTATALAVAAMVAATASLGLVLGACLPLAALGAWSPAAPDRDQPSTRSRWIGPVLWGGAAIVLAVAAKLASEQGDGYIPILGAAKDLNLVDKPQSRRFAQTLQDFGYQTFPWVGLAAVGALHPRGRWPTYWTLLGLALAGAWSQVYGQLALPLAIPTAMGAASGLELLLDSKRSTEARRAALLFALGATLVTRKDAQARPSRVAAPLVHFDGEHRFPDEIVGAAERLGRYGGWALLALLAAGVLARRSNPRDFGTFELLVGRLPPPVRDAAATIAVGGVALAGAGLYARGIVVDLSTALSPRHVVERHRQWVEARQLPPTLATHRLRDKGLTRYYAPDAAVELSNRREIATYLASEEPAAALVKAEDVAVAYQHHRQHGWPLFVLDNAHASYRLIANVLPADATDRNEIDAVVFDDPPQLAHETLIRFDRHIEIVGWEVDGPLSRGAEHTLKLAIRVLRPLPNGTKIYTRFLLNRLCRINTEPTQLAQGRYPPHLWRRGDFILHSYTFTVPPLENMPGNYDFVIGLRRSERDNFKISVPEAKEGEFGVVLRDKKRNFATLGQVEVW